MHPEDKHYFIGLAVGLITAFVSALVVWHSLDTARRNLQKACQDIERVSVREQGHNIPMNCDTLQPE